MTESVVPNNSASENAQIPGTIGTSAVAEHKGDSFNGTSIITIGRVDLSSAIEPLFVPVSTLWSITPGNYPLSAENIKNCTAVRFEGEELLTQNFALGSIVVYKINGVLGNHVIVVSEDRDGGNDNRAIYCNSFNTTCNILSQYGIAFAELYRRKVLELDQVLYTNLNRSLLQTLYVENETDVIDLEWNTKHHPTLYVHASNLVASEEHGFVKYDGRMAGIGTFSTKCLTADRNGNLIKPELAFLNNIIEINVTEKDALEFLNCSITNNRFFSRMVDQLKSTGRKEYDFITNNIDFFAVHVKLNLEEDRPKITRMVLAPDLPILENYLYKQYDPTYLGEAVDDLIQ